MADERDDIEDIGQPANEELIGTGDDFEDDDEVDDEELDEEADEEA